MTTGTSSAGILPNGQSYGSSLANATDDILLGGGNLYLVTCNGLTAIPNDSVIETEANNVGWCESGFKITYKPKVAKVYNQFNQLVKTFITSEDITAKTGILSWNVENLSLLSNAQYINTPTEKRVVFTGSGTLQTVILRFVHTKPDGGKIRFTMAGEGASGFGIDFSDKATSVNAEITAVQYFNNFLAEFREEITQVTPTP